MIKLSKRLKNAVSRHPLDGYDAHLCYEAAEALDAKDKKIVALEAALKNVRHEARKNKPDPDKLFELADGALSKRRGDG